MLRICIVFEETGPRDAKGDQPFNVYMEGHDSERMKSLPDDKLSAAEFWAKKCLGVIIGLLKQSGAARSVQAKGKA